MIERIKKSLQTKLKTLLVLLVTVVLYNGWEPSLGIFRLVFYDFTFNHYGAVDILTFSLIMIIAYKNGAFSKVFDIFRWKNLLFILFLLLVGLFLLC
ncbi:hypothetical protein LLT5_14485 [Lactococcus cremoris subsp. cremoris TIFN5]|nr:hypothetical protein LLT5_14485 [Lactococcus cremoris subsp. cremoris TIFN5]